MIRLNRMTPVDFVLQVMEGSDMLLTTAVDDPEYHVLCADPRKGTHCTTVELSRELFVIVLDSGRVQKLPAGSIDQGEWWEPRPQELQNS